MRAARFLAGLCFMAGAAAPAGADPVFLPYAPATGSTWEISETRTRTTQQGGRQVSQQAGSIVATLKVVDETDEGYVMEWTTASVGAGGVTMDGILPDLLIGIPIRFNTDTEGLPVEIMDSAALLDAAIGGLNKRAAKAGLDQAEASTRALFANSPPRTLAQILLPEVSAIGSCHNFNLEPGELISMSDPVTALGGQTVEATTSVIMEHAGSETEPARIKLTQQISKGEISGVINQVIEGAARAPSAAEQAAFSSMSRKTVTDCTVDPESGETASVVVDMVVSATGMQLHDRREIAMKRVN